MIILASASPRRSELLKSANVEFTVLPADCDEAVLPSETPERMVERLAFAKAAKLADENPENFVIGADTTVFIDNQILGKPESREEAIEMLSKIQGRTHQVWSGICILNRSQNYEWVKSFCSDVTMASMTSELISWYVDTGEPMDKAGAYAIQGIGLQFVDKIIGSYSNVVGLNLAALMAELRRIKAVPS